jgi:nanoRNase/pAp phosphatase (c-di-AMP/oligoRNAs hydrolase)
MAMVNLLDPILRSADDYKAEDYAINILVDTLPSYAGVGSQKVAFQIVVDHHKDVSNNTFDGLLINLNAGSACGTVYDIIRGLNLQFSDDNDNDSRVATAMMVGITTDTDHMMSEDSTQYEFDAWSDLFGFRNAETLKKIVNYERPQLWVNAEADAVRRVVINDAIAVVGMGVLPGKHRDLLADMASKLVCWEGVRTGVAFAIVDGDRVEGSVRSTNASVMVPSLCKKLGTAFGTEYGDGGGKRGKGAYRYTLAGGSIEEDDDEETRQKVCELISDKETKRIFRIMSK